jgi:hypothetical protein
MASAPDGNAERPGGGARTDYPLDFEDSTEHHTDDEDVTEDEEQMEVGAAEDDIAGGSAMMGDGPKDSDTLKERTHASISTAPPDSRFTVSEKAKKFIAENRTVCGGSVKNIFSNPSRKKITEAPPPPPAHGENNLRYRTGSEGGGGSLWLD